MVSSVLDSFQDASDLAIGVSLRLMCGIALGFGVIGEAVEFSVEFVDERGDKLRRHHSLTEALQDPRLDLVASDAKSIRAGAFGAACCASVPVGPDDRVCA